MLKLGSRKLCSMTKRKSRWSWNVLEVLMLIWNHCGQWRRKKYSRIAHCSNGRQSLSHCSESLSKTKHNWYQSIAYNSIQSWLNCSNRNVRNKNSSKQQKPRKKEAKTQRKPQPRNRQKRTANSQSPRRKQYKNAHTHRIQSSIVIWESKKCINAWNRNWESKLLSNDYWLSNYYSSNISKYFHDNFNSYL